MTRNDPSPEILATELNPLQRFKTAKAMSDDALSKLLDLERTFVYRLRTGKRGPSMATARKIQERTGGAVPIQAWPDVQ